MFYTSDSSTENAFEINYTLNTHQVCADCSNITQFHNQTYNESWSEPSVVCALEDTEDIFTYVFQTCVFIMYSAVFVVALLGNGLVCFVVHSTPRMKTVTNYFIVNLAVGDILMTLFCVPFSFVSQLVLRYWPFGAIMCKAVNYSQAVSVLVSAYTLLAISIDRYIVIMHPLKPRLGKTAAKLVVIAVWVGAFITAAPIPIVSQLQRPSPWHQICEIDFCSEQWSTPEQSGQYTIALLVLQFALPLGALVCTYARIAHVVWGGRPPGEAQDARDSRMQHSKRKMVKMMVTVVAVFTISWLPLNVFIVAWTVYGDDAEWGAWPGWPYLWFASHWLAMSHSCYNPIIYGYMNARYRRGFKQILSGLSCLKMKDGTRPFQRSSVCEGVPLSGKDRLEEHQYTRLKIRQNSSMAACSIKTANKRIIVSGGRGALGQACVYHFKQSNAWVASIDLHKNEQADVNIIVSNEQHCVQQEKVIMQQLADVLQAYKVHAVVCVAGGWIRGLVPSLSKQVDVSWRQSVWPASIAAIIASKYLLPQGVLTLTGSKGALEATPGMIGYGMSKAAVHQLTKSLASKEFGMPHDSVTVAILPMILDTEMNRKLMPDADYTSWTPVSFVAQTLWRWIKGNRRPPNGSLVSFVTKNNVTEMAIHDILVDRQKQQLEV